MAQPSPTNSRWEVDRNVDPDEVKAFYTESDREQILGAIEKHVGVSSISQAGILEAVFTDATFFFFELQNQKHPAPEEVRERLEKIGMAARSLTDAINSADELTLYHLLREMSGDEWKWPEVNLAHPNAMDIAQLLDKQVEARLSARFADLPLLSEAANTALINLPKGKPGKQPGWALHQFIRRQSHFFLAWVYTAKRSVAFDQESQKYYGPLFDYIEACLTPIDPNPERSNQALGGLIQRALRYQHSTVKNIPTWWDWPPK